MATDDCSEFGNGPCPCGKGKIIVEQCSPDHPWAKPHQTYYTAQLNCDECKQKYEFYSVDSQNFSRLVLRENRQKKRDADAAWHKKLREIKNSPEFKSLSNQLDKRLSEENSATARHRLLVRAGMGFGIPIARYRRSGYSLEVLDASRAIKLLGIQILILERLLNEERALAEANRSEPPAVKTGIRGLAE